MHFFCACFVCRRNVLVKIDHKLYKKTKKLCKQTLQKRKKNLLQKFGLKNCRTEHRARISGGMLNPTY